MTFTAPEVRRLRDRLNRTGVWSEIELVLHGALKKDRGNPQILSLLADAALIRRDFKLAANYFRLAKVLAEANLSLGSAPIWEREKLATAIAEFGDCEQAALRMAELPHQAAELFETEPNSAIQTVKAKKRRTFPGGTFEDPMLSVVFAGLSSGANDYVAAIKTYLAKHGLVDSRLGVYACGPNAEAVLREFDQCELSKSIVAFQPSDDAPVTVGMWPKFRGGKSIFDVQPRVTLVHLSDGQDEPTFIRECASKGLLRNFGHLNGGPHTVLILNGTTREATLEEIDHPYPVLIRTTGNAARTRFMPTMKNLAECMGRELLSPPTFTNIAARFTQLRERENPTDRDLSSYYAAMSLEYYEVMAFHYTFRWDMLRNDDRIRAILLIRDPRDMCISQIKIHPMRLGQLRSTEEDVEDWILNYSRDIVHEMLEAIDFGAYLHRFEDLHLDERGAGRRLLAWLGWRDRISDQLLDDALHLGSYEYQSGGQRQRGESDNFQKFTATGAYLRKGISGDWKNYFTGANKDLCKRYIGPELIKLGYEQDLDW